MSNLTIAAVNSGRRVMLFPPLSIKVYISLVIISELSPKVFVKTSVYSNIGV
ncbi:hypothetical protein wTpre_1184 [Wolbachia endosymbiont of Trichogramma pretiosum]|nr:hypothetical protein wTpre_1184 [Wolbachia endosymbiont of Trichogramma pretiosum]